MQPNVLDCVSDITYKCVYTYDSVSQHSFTVPLLNGVIAGEYEEHEDCRYDNRSNCLRTTGR